MSISSTATEGKSAVRSAYLLYSVVCYVLFLAVFLYAIGFVGNLLVPKGIDDGPVEPLATALLIDVLLLSAFAVQHSLMARPFFKHWWTKYIRQPIERSTYVLASNLVLALLYWQWRPIPAAVWDLGTGPAAVILWAVFAVGWIIVLVSTFLLDHFELFGLRQPFEYFAGRPQSPPEFRTPLLYRLVRHPIMLGFVIAFWATPRMSWGHLLFAATTTVYILLAIRWEEVDLLAAFGPDYSEYKKNVPAILPMPPGRQSADVRP